MTAITMAEISQLSTAERIQLVQDIWDSIWSMPEHLDLTEAQRQELDRRLQRYRQEPESSVPWDEVKWRIQNIKQFDTVIQCK
ncbi:MAG: addiction module protein [Caldilineaceae bacterium]